MARPPAIALLLAFGVALHGQTPAEPAAGGYARALQAHYDTVRDFTADFTQTYVGGVLRKRLVERGTVAVKKPGRMRWTYTSPEPKVFVSDGSQIYSYVPADRQVFVSPMPEPDEAATALLFLSGSGNLLRDFEVRPGEEGAAPPGAVALLLAPRQAQRDYDTLTLVVDHPSLRLRSLVATDGQGGTSTFEFRNLQENVGLTDNAFEFKIPRGADVIRSGNPSR